MSLLAEIRDAAIDGNTSTATMLRKCLVLAVGIPVPGPPPPLRVEALVVAWIRWIGQPCPLRWIRHARKQSLGSSMRSRLALALLASLIASAVGCGDRRAAPEPESASVAHFDPGGGQLSTSGGERC